MDYSTLLCKKVVIIQCLLCYFQAHRLHYYGAVKLKLISSVTLISQLSLLNLDLGW